MAEGERGKKLIVPLKGKSSRVTDRIHFISIESPRRGYKDTFFLSFSVFSFAPGKLEKVVGVSYECSDSEREEEEVGERIWNEYVSIECDVCNVKGKMSCEGGGDERLGSVR